MRFECGLQLLLMIFVGVFSVAASVMWEFPPQGWKAGDSKAGGLALIHRATAKAKSWTQQFNCC